MDNFLIQHIREITRMRSNSEGSILDLVITKEEDYVSDITYGTHLGRSDHLVLKITVCEMCNYVELEPSKRFQYHKGDYEGIREELGKISWSTIFAGKDISDCWSIFKAKLLELQEEFIPTIQDKPNDKPKWMNRSVVLALNEKKRAWKKYLFCKTNENFEQYKVVRNKLKSIVYEARLSFERKVAIEAKVNPKSFWKYVGRKIQPASRLQQVRNTAGALSQSNFESATFFNLYFASVFTLDDTTRGESYDYPDPTRNLMQDIIIKEEAILQSLEELKVDKAMGPDGLSPRILVEAKEYLVLPLKLIFSMSLSQGELPLDWKSAVVVPIFKNGKRDMPQNYRPVSLTSVVCKIMEKIIRNALIDHLMMHGLLSQNQFGFVPGRSCALQLLVCMENWTKALDDGGNVDIIYTDFSKAFDTVSHSKLLWKLHALGVRSKTWAWIQDFLKDRRQKVRVNGSYSDWVKVQSGVPQGSVLGPVLFVVYINDLPAAIPSGRVKLFADDAKLDKTINTVEDVSALQNCLDKMLAWSEHWALKLNVNKCKVLHVSRRQNQSEQDYYLNSNDSNIQLESVSFEKDLGVYIDRKLCFETHVSKSVNKANRNMGIIYRNFKLMGEDVFVSLYKSMIRPHVEYSSVVWNPTTIRDQKSIEGVQRRATKLVRGLSELSYEERLRKLGIPTLQYRRLWADMLQVYKIVHGVDRINPETFFTFADSSITRGHKYKILKQRSKTTFRLHAFSNRVVDAWNELPAYVVEAPNVNVFKSRLNTAWKGHPQKFLPSFY